MINYEEIVKLSNACQKKTLEQRESWFILDCLSDWQIQNFKKWFLMNGCLIENEKID